MESVCRSSRRVPVPHPVGAGPTPRALTSADKTVAHAVFVSAVALVYVGVVISSDENVRTYTIMPAESVPMAVGLVRPVGWVIPVDAEAAKAVVEVIWCATR